jgi:hypothetical protein
MYVQDPSLHRTAVERRLQLPGEIRRRCGAGGPIGAPADRCVGAGNRVPPYGRCQRLAAKKRHEMLLPRVTIDLRLHGENQGLRGGFEPPRLRLLAFQHLNHASLAERKEQHPAAGRAAGAKGETGSLLERLLRGDRNSAVPVEPEHFKSGRGAFDAHDISAGGLFMHAREDQPDQRRCRRRCRDAPKPECG